MRCDASDQAATVFLDALALTVFDSAHGESEERWFTLGYDAKGTLLAVAHTYQATGPAAPGYGSCQHARQPSGNGVFMRTNLDR